MPENYCNIYYKFRIDWDINVILPPTIIFAMVVIGGSKVLLFLKRGLSGNTFFYINSYLGSQYCKSQLRTYQENNEKYLYIGLFQIYPSIPLLDILEAIVNLDYMNCQIGLLYSSWCFPGQRAAVMRQRSDSRRIRF